MKTGGKCIKYPCFCGFWYTSGGGKCRKNVILLVFCAHYYLNINYLRAINQIITYYNSKNNPFVLLERAFILYESVIQLAQHR